MIGWIVGILLCVGFGTFAAGAFMLNAGHKEYEKMRQELEDNENRKKQQKESMETGSAIDDFNQSINILHQHAAAK